MCWGVIRLNLNSYMLQNGFCILEEVDILGLVNLASLGVIHKEHFFPLGNSDMDARDRMIIEFMVEVAMDVESGFTAEGVYHGDGWLVPCIPFMGKSQVR